MAENASRRGAVDMGMIMMLLAFAVIAGFVFWLRSQAASERAMEIREDSIQAAQDSADMASGPAARTITPADIQTNPEGMVGETVRIADVKVNSRLGQKGFWLDLDSGPFLVALSDSLVADSISVPVESTVAVTGTMRAMNDSTAAAWHDGGTISEGDQLAASFASNYIEASRVQVTQTAPSGN